MPWPGVLGGAGAPKLGAVGGAKLGGPAGEGDPNPEGVDV